MSGSTGQVNTWLLSPCRYSHNQSMVCRTSWFMGISSLLMVPVRVFAAHFRQSIIPSYNPVRLFRFRKILLLQLRWASCSPRGKRIPPIVRLSFPRQCRAFTLIMCDYGKPRSTVIGRHDNSGKAGISGDLRGEGWWILVVDPTLVP